LAGVAPTGFLGKLAAERPFLATAVLALGMTSLSIVGIRRSADPAAGAVVAAFIFNAVYVIAAPMVLAAMAPQKKMARCLYFILVILVAAGLVALGEGRFASVMFFTPPPVALTLTAAGLFCFLLALSPLLSTVLKLGVAAPFAAILGTAAAAGYLALDGMLIPAAAAGLAVALAIGVTVGADVSAEFSKLFAQGAAHKTAAAAAGHAAVAPAAFSVLATGALLSVQTIHTNFGAIEWPALWGAAAAALLAAVMALIGVTGSLSVTVFGEQVAVDENRRRQWFTTSWRPMRRLLPATTALAATAIAGVVVVVAIFEAGVAAPMSLLFFLVLIWGAAALAFVSLRTSILIVAIVFVATLMAGYFYAVMGWPLPELPERLTGLTLAAISLGHLTVSWRDAGEIWRNTRDITENAMSDGMRRFLLTLGLGAASLVVAAYSFGWAEGIGTAVYLIVTSGVSLLLAPMMMIAMSAKSSRY